MSRTTVKATYKDAQTTQEIIEKVLKSHNYKLVSENGEHVWKCGIGFWTAIKYVQVEFADGNTLVISGWIRPMGGEEMELKGMLGCFPKVQVKKVIKELIEKL